MLIDTAGIRRRGRIEQGIEKYALLRTARALERADVAVLLVDATEGLTAQDVHVAGYAIEAGVGIVLGLNKWDLVERGEENTERVKAEIARELHFAPWIGHRFVSAKTGRNVETSLADAVAIVDRRKTHVPTGELHAHPHRRARLAPAADEPGKAVRFHHVTQAHTRTPTFVFFVDTPDLVHFSYQRFLENRIRAKLRLRRHADPSADAGRPGVTALLLAVLFVLPGYVIGSISSGYLVGKVYRNVDLRKVGSGSTGATNTLRTLGPGAALLVALLDILKGVTAVLVARAIYAGPPELEMVAAGSAAVGAVAGHCWPLLLEGRGGRGVAVGFGAIMVIATQAWVVSVTGFALGLLLTRIVSVASLSAVTGALVGYAVLTAAGVITFQWGAVGFLVVAAVIIVYRHRANIDRLLRGAEPRIGRA